LAARFLRIARPVIFRELGGALTFLQSSSNWEGSITLEVSGVAGAVPAKERVFCNHTHLVQKRVRRSQARCFFPPERWKKGNATGRVFGAASGEVSFPPGPMEGVSSSRVLLEVQGEKRKGRERGNRLNLRTMVRKISIPGDQEKHLTFFLVGLEGRFERGSHALLVGEVGWRRKGCKGRPLWTRVEEGEVRKRRPGQ